MIEAVQKNNYSYPLLLLYRMFCTQRNPQHAFEPHFQPEFIINSYRCYGELILSFSILALKPALLMHLLCVALV